MPFQIVRQLRYVSGAGNLSLDEKFEIVLENGVTLIGGIAYTEYPETALCLHKNHWPREVRAACDEMLAEFREAYPELEINLNYCMAWIRTPQLSGPSNELAVGTQGFTITMQYGGWGEGSRSIVYSEAIADLKPLP